jgi:hypothetical protein
MSGSDEIPIQTDATDNKQTDRRSQRIADYCAAALENPCPLAADVGVVNSDLMRVQCFVQEALNHAIAEIIPTLTGLASVTPGIDTLLKVNKQIDRYTQLEIQLAQADWRGTGLGDSQSGVAKKNEPTQ